MKHLLEYLEFDELSDSAKDIAVERVKEEKYKGNYGGDDVSWVIDDDALFEPPHEEMAELFGEDYYEINGAYMIENDRDDISFEGTQSQNYYLHCKKALNVTNDNLFFRWLGIPTRFWKFISYNFAERSWSGSNTAIEFEIDDTEEMADNLGENAMDILDPYLEKAEQKFKEHISNVLRKISNSIDEEFEDDGIINTIEANNIHFTEEGEIED